MKTLLSLLLGVVISLSLLNAQTNCKMSDLEVVDVSNCTYNTYVVRCEFQVQNPVGDAYKFAYKALPNGNWIIAGELSYPNTRFSMGTLKKNLSYAVYIYDLQDNSCSLRDTILPLTCQAPCRIDSLMLANIWCYPGSNQIELRFEYPTFNFTGGYLYDAFEYGDTNKIGNLWMAPWGNMYLDRQYEQDTITLCQVGADSTCCKNFVIPECINEICPISWVDGVRAVRCVNGMVQYEFFIEHGPALDNYTTEVVVYDENRMQINFSALKRNETTMVIEVPESNSERTFTICDLYEVCCYDLVLPGADCDSLMTSSRSYEIAGLSMYPNPAFDRLTLDLSATMIDPAGMQYSIINIMGQHLAGGIVRNQVQQIDISSLTGGTYYLQLITSDGRIDCRPFVKIE